MNAKKLSCYCGCNGKHGQAIKTVSSLAKLTDIVPSGLKVLVLTDSPAFRKEIARFYRTQIFDFCGAAASDNHNEESFASPKNDNTGGNSFGAEETSRSINREISGQHIAGAALCNNNENETAKWKKAISRCDFAVAFDLLQPDEDVRLVISDGGYVPFGKYIAARLDVAHAAVDGGFSRYELVKTSVFASEKLQNTIAVEDFERVDLPRGFAFVMSMTVALFDWDVSALLFGGQMCGDVFRSAQKIIMRVLESAKMLSRRSPQLKNELLRAQIDMAALVDARDGGLLLSGATQSAAALSMLFAYEERDMPDIFSTAFLLAPIVTKIYAAFLEKEIPFAFPPDNNLRASRLSEYLGLPQYEAYPCLPAHMDIKKLRLADYRLSVYRQQLLSQIYDIIRMLTDAQPIFLRLFEDDGFALQGLFGCLDSSLAVGLGSDVLPADTLLSYMRAKGVLDRFIL